MTDSMKFGPEWLRNMSADTTSFNSTNASGQITSPTSGLASGNPDCGRMSVNNANSNSSNLNTSNLSNNINAPNSGASRNTFPEFRYSREEMLLLFDRNYCIPEILPSYKNLYVERAQFPLALVPSTDEEMMQSSTPLAQRPWFQRSPVGFSAATRGTGRVGCMDRSRMRGKSAYHPVFQRPNSIFDDEQRASAIKTDRSWADKNGAAGDQAVSGPSTTAGGLSADAWNGNTPVSSPRREFCNHPRNIENWRRSRNEDGSGSETTTTTTTFSAEGGWRINTSGSGFQGSQTRWGRSISWRDDDVANNDNSGMGGGSSGTTSISGGDGITLLRSNSSLSATQGERGGHSGVSGSSSGSPGVTRSVSITSSGTRNSVSGNIWPNSTGVSSLSSIQADCNINDEMSLPEWAMENPSAIGGTFDASGAFHGAIEDDEHAGKQQEHDVSEQISEDKRSSGIEIIEKLSKVSDDNSIISAKAHKSFSIKQTDNYQSLLSSPPPSPTTVPATTELTEESDKSKHNNSSSLSQVIINTDTVTLENVSQKNLVPRLENECTAGSAANSSCSVESYQTKIDSSENKTKTGNVGDYADRMMKATDDMIEKLIMDDEDAKDNHMKTPILSAENKINVQNIYMAMQQTPNSSHPSVSPALGVGAGTAGAPNMSIYNMGGIMVDHTHNMTALHQLQQQQMAAVAIGLQPTPHPPHSISSASPTDLWLYRDPQTKVQGPFSALEMTEWYRAGYFNENLFVRRACDARFRPLGELIKICNGQMPFSQSHLIPVDLNPTTLTPPIPTVIPTQPATQATNFLIKSLNEHQEHQQHEKLKGNVTAAADSLSNALKSLISSVDISQVLNMHFQTLQDRFIHNQEIEIANELSQNECFRRLSPAEKDAVVRQKLQALILPEYLTNLTGLSNSLAALNPTAGTQLYETIAECTKKEQLFSNHQVQLLSQASVQQQRTNHHISSSSTPYMDADNFVIKSKNSDHDVNSNGLLNEFNLRMFLNNSTDPGTGSSGGIVTQNSHDHEFLNDQQIFGAGTNTSPSNNSSQSPMIQMWMNSLAANQTNAIPNQQHSLMDNVSQPTTVNNQWINGPLVGIPSISLSREQHTSGRNIGSPKHKPASMWDVATLEQHVQVQQQQQHEQKLQQQAQQHTFAHQRQLKDIEKNVQNHIDQHKDIDKQSTKQEENRNELEQQQQNSANEIEKCPDSGTKVSFSKDGNNKHEQQRQTQQQPPVYEKSYSYVNNKRNSTNNINSLKLINKGKNENTAEQISKKTEEERRREQNEDKRRQKEERKRLQMEEEKRRIMQAEEEKRRQIQEEEKRQQQIQAQRRKALMSNINSNCSANNGNNTNMNNSNHKSKEQRVQSSVAPWSTQTMAKKLQGPGLAEIQKAERRERRADQQRQLEIQEKQLRALAAAAEAQETILKWNAAPVPVKSFAEIQAEEAKRLANEQLEMQRRKDQEAHNNLVAFNSTGNTVPGGLNSANIASIWSGNKIWGTLAHSTGFWDDPLKFNNKSLSAALINNNSNNSNLTIAAILPQSSNLQQKVTTSQQQRQLTSTPQPSSNKNIKKSQSITVMQNTASLPTANTSSGLSNQKKASNNTTPAIKQQKPQKADSNFGAVGGGSGSGSNENKKTTTKNGNVANKGDDYEVEFTNWCTKSLNNMSTKVDVPTFVSFLRDLESPYEVKDYVRMYLGESKEYIDFAKQFLERRSKYKNLQRAQNAHDDDLCKPAQAITPSINENNENKGRQKKVKKNKMTKLDARILGFSVTAAEGRINVGDRDYGDTP